MVCKNLYVLYPIFNTPDHLMNIQLKKKGPALYDHFLPIAAGNSQVKCQLQKFSILLGMINKNPI